MKHPRERKRFLIAGIGAVLAVLAGLLGAAPASAQEPPPGLIPEGDWTQPQIDWMLAQIDWTETVLPQNFPTSYSGDGSEVEALGYHNFGATAPGGYDHWISNDRLFDQHVLNPNQPESLVYQNVGNGVWELRAAMFMLDPQIEHHMIPPMLSWIPGWHGHPELCVWPDGTFAGVTDPNNPNCPQGSFPAATPVMMHVWLEDPGCGHRFGGVGVGGLHCDVGHDDG